MNHMVPTAFVRLSTLFLPTLIMTFSKRRTARKYAPLWALLFSTTATLAKSAGQRYLLNQKVRINKKDLLVAAGGALLGLVSFHLSHQDQVDGILTS